jgi:hypothetical protein
MQNKKLKNSKLIKVMRGLLFDKRAVSVALSTLIITAGVIAAGIAVLYWAYSWGNIADDQYSKSTSNSMSAMGESLGFEYITYSNVSPTVGNLTVYIINCGTSNKINIARVYLWDSYMNPIGSYNVSTGIPVSGLNVGKEGYFSVSQHLNSSTYYNLRVVTVRGSNFDQAFSTP